MLIHQRYREVTRISEGPQAKVYLVFDESEKQHLILKRYESSSGLDSYLERQVSNCQALTHPQVLVPNKLILDDPICTLCPVVKGMTLWEWAKKRGGLDFQQAGVFLAQLGNLFDYLHRKGVVHRDVKPQNMLVDRKEVLYLLDFDAAFFSKTRFSGMTLSRSFRQLGTSQYMAPEHLRGRIPKPVMDIYSVATSYYQVLSLRFPFGEELEARENAKNYRPVEFLTKRQNDVLKQALDPDPNLRFPSVLLFYKEIYKA